MQRIRYTSQSPPSLPEKKITYISSRNRFPEVASTQSLAWAQNKATIPLSSLCIQTVKKPNGDVERQHTVLWENGETTLSRTYQEVQTNTILNRKLTIQRKQCYFFSLAKYHQLAKLYQTA